MRAFIPKFHQLLNEINKFVRHLNISRFDVCTKQSYIFRELIALMHVMNGKFGQLKQFSDFENVDELI
jgi:hypothetical protein